MPRGLITFGFGVPISLVVLAASPLSANFFVAMAAIPGILLIWFATAIWSLALALRFAMSKRWQSTIAALILPTAALAVGANVPRALRATNLCGDLLHFILARPYYDRRVAALAQPHPRLVVFNWGGMIWSSRGLVYDESDEVALPAGTQSAVWLTNPALAELRCGGFTVQSLWSHYYLASFSC